MKRLLILILTLSWLGARSQAGSEIYLFDLRVNNGELTISKGINITHHKGYDNQPFFHPTENIIYYSSFNDSGRSDIKYYDFIKGITKNLTVTEEREYSPTVTPDGKFISCIIQRDNGAQDLGKYPIGGGKPEVLINNLVVGYHTWIENDKLLLFVLGDSNRHSLHYHDLATKNDKTIALNIGRSLHKIPGKNSMSFVQRINDKENEIKEFDPSSGTISAMVASIPGQDHLAWLKNNILLMSDGNQLFFYQLGKSTEWKPVKVEGDLSNMKGISRLATNSDNTKLAIVVSE